MWNTSGAKIKHFNYNVSRASCKSWEKLEKAINRYIDLLKKEAKLWTTKWIIKTKVKAESRLKKYWVKNAKIEDTLAKRWLKDLVSNINK